MDLIDEIERLRLEQGISQADMAREFGVPSQNYNNWVYRHSLPKSHYAKAQRLLQRSRTMSEQGSGHTSVRKNPEASPELLTDATWIAVTQDEKAALMAARTHPEKTKAFVQFLGMDETERQNLRAYLEIAAGRVPPEKN